VLLRASGLRFAWPGRPALGPLDLELGPGVHWLRGDNGAGKSTLLRLLAGELHPAGGTVAVCGGDPRTVAVRRRLAWLPTEDDLPGFLTAQEACEELAVLRGLADREAAWATARERLQQLGVPAGRRLDQLSQGQRRKAGLVSALVGPPEVLLLDEPFANLDPGSTDRVAAWLGAPCAALTLFTHHGTAPVAVDSEVALSPA
jgi:ABC-2 type transport system ATP-binding protein